MGCGASKQVRVTEPEQGKSIVSPRSVSGTELSGTFTRQGSAASRSQAVADGLEDVKDGLNTLDRLDRMESAGSVLKSAADASGAVAGAMLEGQGAAVTQAVTQATGEALVELAKTLPFIGPVAFLLCAVASSAVTAGVLKQDCMEFVKVLNTVEKILLKVENLESCDSAIDDVREVLEEALGLMNSVQKRGLIASTLLAKSEKNRFEDLKSQLHDALARLNLSSTVEMALLQKTRFDQTEQMRTRLDALGGPKVVLKDPNALKEMESWMEASDQMLMASVGEARKELKTVGDTVAESHWKTVQIAVEQKQHKLLSERSISLLGDTNCKLDMQDQKLDDVTSGFIKLQQEAELSRLQSEILKRQVDELKGMLSEVKGFFNKFPTPPQEPERMLVMNTGNFMALSQNQTPAFETLQSICRDATRKWGVGSTVNMIGDLKQSTVAGCFPTLAKSGAGSCEHPRTAVPAEAADLEPSGEGALCRMAPQIEVEPTDCHGFQAPRKMSVCQHVTG